MDKNIMPWQWDHDTYNECPEMIGKFFREDWNNIQVIHEYRIAYQEYLRSQKQ